MSGKAVRRARWSALGAAVAVALGAGGISISSAAISSGERAVFVSITPCRLFDTRPAYLIGPRSTPLNAGESYTQIVRGTNGNCTIPVDAVAVAMNVTVVNGTAGSFLTIYPSDVALPNSSSLNWQAGSPPTPNKVDVRLSADGKINFYNFAGKVDVLADVVGYYADHNFDDRYLPKNGSVVLGHPAFVNAGNTSFVSGCVVATSNVNLEASVPLPVGVTITSFKAFVIDSNGATDVTVSLIKTTAAQTTLASASTTATPGLTTITGTLGTPERVDSGEYFYLRFAPSVNFASMDICGAEVIYTAEPFGPWVGRRSAGTGVAFLRI